MYEMVWSETGFQVVKVNAPGAKRITATPPAPSRPPAFSNPVDRSIWRNFVRSGKADLSCLNRSIAESWQRCRRLGVDPAFGKCQNIRNTRELDAESRGLSDLVAETRNEIYEHVRGRGLLITISDRQGYLISMCGDYRTLLTADRLNFGPGANWSEASVGTNAIGTALVSEHALVVSGREHFCEGHHAWICSAAPIFDLFGRVMGCVDISGPTSANHHMALTLAVKSARAVESQMLKQQAAELQEQSSRIVSSAFSVVTTGLMVMDTGGISQNVNPAAAILLNRKTDELIGSRADACFEMQTAIRQLSDEPGIFGDRGMPVACKTKGATAARLYPVTTPNGALTAILLVLEALQHPRCISIPAEPLPADDPFHAVIGQSSAIRGAVEIARRVARTATTVLICGESGTGKEVLARAIHNAGIRAGGPFLAVNCGAFPQELIQSELFGYAPGAFTGASRGGSAGKFEQASGGTLFLDEVSEMPLNLQVNLLRVLEEGHITRVGGNRPVTVDVRIIAATNKDLHERVLANAFRQDLFYRLKVVTISLPSLRARGRDIDLLAAHFIHRLSEKLKRPVERVDPDFFVRLRELLWHGNVRELKNTIEGAIALMPGHTLSADCLCDPHPESREPVSEPAEEDPLNLAAVEKQTIQRAHARFSGNVSRMARALGIGRNTLYAKLRKYGIS